MDITLKNILLAGIGTIAYTYEKASEMVDELVTKGELTVMQGKQLNEELKRTVKMNDSQKMQAVDINALKEAIASFNLATKQDLDELKQRIADLENR